MKKNAKTEQKPQALFADGDELYLSLVNNPADFGRIAINSDALSKYGVFRKDLLFYKSSHTAEENQLSVWESKGKWEVGFAFNNFGDISIYLPGYEVRRFKKREINILGVVVGVIRFSNYLLEDSTEHETTEEKDEALMTAVCKECKSQLAGTRDFLKKMGWRIKKDFQLCVHCDLF